MRATQLSLAIGMVLASSAHAGDLLSTNAPVPTSDLEKRSILTPEYAYVDGRKTEVEYNTIMRSGTQPGTSTLPFGMLIDKNGDPIIGSDGHYRVSNDNDFSSLIKGRGKELYMVSHFESRPAAMYLTKLWQDPRNGKLTAVKTRPLDFSHVNGGWTHCAGSVSPWNTHIGSEEYPPNSKAWRDKTIDSYNAEMAQYFGVQPVVDGGGNVTNQDEIIAAVNPYDYGYVIEVDVKNFNKADVVKHYSMGRVAIELAYVMPNEKTVYISDDGSNVGLFRYQADKKGDLSSGTLYAAKFVQTSDYYPADSRVEDDRRDGGKGEIQWVWLGHASDQEVRAMIDQKLTFDDIFEENGPGCRIVNTRDGSNECLTLRPGMQKAAAFLETSRFASYKSATTEFEKMEGITFNPDTKTMYLAMSRVRNAMTDGAGDISVPYNYCGTVYALDLNRNYVAYNMYGLVAGKPRLYSRGAIADNPYDPNGPYADNQCDLDHISEPDNVTFMPGYDVLVIGEDTGLHQNDAIWGYDLRDQSLTRLQTTPYGSETTSPYFYPNINGFAYLTSVIQHPFGESDQNALLLPEEELGYTGYIGPLPAMDGKGRRKHHDEWDRGEDD